MKWTLDIEGKDIDVDIQKDIFTLKTEADSLHFMIDSDVAYNMLMYMKAFLEHPWCAQEEKVVQFIGEKTLIMYFFLVPGNKYGLYVWEMHLILADSVFYAKMSFEDIVRFSKVLAGYFKTGRFSVNVYVRDGCPYSSKLLFELEDKGFDYDIKHIDAAEQKLITRASPVLQTPDNFYVLPDLFHNCDLDKPDVELLDKILVDLTLPTLQIVAQEEPANTI